MDRRTFINTLGIASGAVTGSALIKGGDAGAMQPTFDIAAKAVVLSGRTLVAASNAPPAVKRAANFVCSGTDDHLQINQAIEDLGDIGGVVQLSQGTFNCANAIRMRRLTTLFGEGRSTVLKAIGSWSSFDGLEAQGGVIEPASVSTDRTAVGHLSIDGNQYQNADVQGIYYNITTQESNWGGPDADHSFTDLYVSRTRRHGIQFKGSRMRATKLSRTRLFDIGQEGQSVAHGFYLQSPDSFYSMCECGGATGHGFFIDGSNLHFSNCKAWFSDLNGWNITATRGQYSSCESQDNQGHGFYISAGPNSLVGCHADSNSWNSSAPESSYDGFHLPFTNRVQLIGCAAYDKGESSHNGYWQRDGFHLGASCADCQIIGVVRDNTRSGVFGGDNPDNLVMVQGQ